MNYSLISLLLISVCLLGQNIVATESEADCEFDLNKSVQSRKSHENNNKHYYECESNGLFVKKQCADGLLFDEDVLVSVEQLCQCIFVLVSKLYYDRMAGEYNKVITFDVFSSFSFIYFEFPQGPWERDSEIYL